MKVWQKLWLFDAITESKEYNKINYVKIEIKNLIVPS